MNNNIIKFQLPNPTSKYKVNPEAFDATLISESVDGSEVTLTFDGAVTAISSEAVVSRQFPAEFLAGLELPNSVESINGRSFYILHKDIKFHLIDENGFVINNGVLMAIFADDPKEIVIPEGVTTIGTHVLHQRSVGVNCTIKFPKSLRRLEDHAFDDCLCKYTLNKGLEYVGEGALIGMQNTTLTIPTTVKYIGDYGFADAECAKKIVIKHEIDHIGRGAFGSESSGALQKVEGVYASEDGLMLIKDGVLMRCVTNIKALIKSHVGGIEIPDGTTILDECSICNVRSSIKLPKGLQEIRKGALSNCIRRGSVDIPESVEVIEDGAFRNAQIDKVSGKFTTNNGKFIIDNGRLIFAATIDETLKIPAETNCIAPYAIRFPSASPFMQKTLNVLDLPKGIKSIDKYAFGRTNAYINVSISTVIIRNENPFDWDMQGISPETIMIVPDKSVEKFKEAYPDRADNIKGLSMIDN